MANCSRTGMHVEKMLGGLANITGITARTCKLINQILYRDHRLF